MKNSVSHNYFVVGLLFLLTSFCQLWGQANFLKNGGFEDGTLNPWIPIGDATKVQVAAPPQYAYKSKWCAAIKRGGGLYTVVTGLQPNKKYIVNGYLTGQGGEPIFLYVTDYSDNPNDSLSFTANTDLKAVPDYKFFSGLITIGSTKNSVKLRLWRSLATYQWCSADSLGVYEAPEDNVPPSKPIGLTVSNQTSSSCTLTWNTSTDNVGIAGYNVLENGVLIGTTNDTIFQVKNRVPASIYNYSVVAFDVVPNYSVPSDLFAVNYPDVAPIEPFLAEWSKPQSKVLPTGDLQWQPNPFTYKAGANVRYIDFDGGKDSNDGLTQATAFKHHPWDKNAASRAKICTGPNTYVFKRGVIYRGILNGAESGTVTDTLKLTSDPNWGTGDAMIYGSQKITIGWTKCDATSAPKIPNPDKIWYINLSTTYPSSKMVAEVVGDNVTKLELARIPNQNVTDSLIPLKNWWKWTGVTGNSTNTTSSSVGSLEDTNNLTQTDPTYWVGGTVWSQWQGTMGTVWNQPISSYDPTTHSIVTPLIYAGVGKRYFIENLPQLLDTINEYWFDKSGTFPGRLYVRLSGDRDPNTTTLEFAMSEKLISLTNPSYLSISGLKFGFNTYDKYNNVDAGAKDIAAIINLTGYSHHVEIKNCKFYYVNSAIAVDNTTDAYTNVNNITVSDNDIRHVSSQAIAFSNGGGKFMESIRILRNNLYECGTRQLSRWYSAIPAIATYLKSGEIAGNFIKYSWGSGIYATWGKTSGDVNTTTPFIKGFVHHNRVENSILATSDWGGIECWQGGPVYYYNNYSKNAHGWTGNTDNQEFNPWGFPYYFDGAFKAYAFNNIAVSPYNSLTDPSKRNRSGYQFVLGMFDILANNTSHNFFMGLVSQDNEGGLPYYNTFVGNAFNDVSLTFVNQNRIPTDRLKNDSYANNVLFGKVTSYYDYSGGYCNTFDSFQKLLSDNKAHASQLGWEASHSLLPNASSNDFIPSATSEVVDKGVKVFVPMSLAAVTGEWSFTKHAADSSMIMGENLYMTTEYGKRGEYDKILKNDMKAFNLSNSSFVKGDLEDWTLGALKFDGVKTYCSVADNSPQQALTCNNLNMTTNNFIIETYLKTEIGHSNSTVVSKSNEAANGYALALNNEGKVEFRLYIGGSLSYSITSSSIVNEGAWHHILAEVVRRKGVNIYVDGKLANGVSTGSLPDKMISLTNSSDFLVGKNTAGNYFAGTIDFLRISKGSLEEAYTTIDELYKWGFNGPFLYDFAGKAPIGKRDAGALEVGQKLCNLNLSATGLDYTYEGGDKTITITAENGFEIQNPSASFITTSLSGNNLKITLAPNTTTTAKNGTVKIFGCNETYSVKITQAAKPTMLDYLGQSLELFPNPTSNSLYVKHNFSSNVLIGIYDLNGQQIILKNNVSPMQNIDISNLAAGVYIVKCKTDDVESRMKLIKK